LNLFIKSKLPEVKLHEFKRPLVVGSGNAAVTGKILFDGLDAVFADEGNYLHKLESIYGIDGCILISASGGKHAPKIALNVSKFKIPIILLTNNKSAPARPFVTKTHVFPKNPEPYTYNTSTYMGMIIAKTQEHPRKIKNSIQKIKIPKNLGDYDSFYLIVPEEFDLMREMFSTKFDELFGPMISGRVFTPEQTKHAKTVVPSKKELFISFGYDNKLFGEKRLNIPLPKGAGFATLMAIGYHVIGQIQKQHPQYYKENIVSYTKDASRLFHSEIRPIVD
jgi:hypothetical protein